MYPHTPPCLPTLNSNSRLNQRFSEVVEHERMRSEEVGETGRLPGMHISAGHYGTLKGIAAALDIGGLYGIPE